ncbi:MAG: 16S rRNA (uracil(1498)-N(3))-methyltransferase [Holosporaceae bacterium]|jgi:16S rRNA (uracil1498-N3)-methyltransferase|nr:16S rRNA (uracil(1498)-N(3))-methyltransferase [Holosporaceae bacterium]
MKHIARFYALHKLSAHAEVSLDNRQMHHAIHVLRLKKNDDVIMFNEHSGEWHCQIIDEKKTSVKCISILRNAMAEKGPVLAISLINPVKMSLLLEKTTELGVTKIIPVISQYTQYKNFNLKKAENIVIGASEQSRRMTIPQICAPLDLQKFLNTYPFNFPLLVGDETRAGIALKDAVSSEIAFLVGPEGGFSTAEFKMMEKYDFIKKITIGKNILRSETAAIAAMAVWNVLEASLRE